MAKQYEPEDPNELVAVSVPGGNSDQVLDGLVQEYLLMGWTEWEIKILFRSPYYGATHQLFREKGEAQVNERIHDLAEQWNQGWIKSREPSQLKGDEQDA